MIVVYIFLALIVLTLLGAFLMPASYRIEKTAIVKKPVPDVMKYVGDLNAYADWNPWAKMEPTAKKTITGTPGSSGHAYAWEGKKIGVGSLTLKSADSAHLHFDLQFLKPWKSQASDDWHFEAWGDGETKITWTNSGPLAWPMARLMGPLISKNLNKQFETGLGNLKEMCER